MKRSWVVGIAVGLLAAIFFNDNFENESDQQGGIRRSNLISIKKHHFY